MITAVAAIAIGGTIAYFSDTETSQGNIFTAGSIDLTVDHTRQTYNGVDCKTCSVEVFSSPATTDVVAASAGASFQAVPGPATDVSNPHPAWQNEAALAPAQWIWATEPTTVADTTNGAEYTFENKFQWNGSAVSVDLNLALAADNGYKVTLNGTEIVNKLSDEFTYASAVPLTTSQENVFMGAMVNGENTLDIVVRNKPLAANPVTGNPAGLLFKLNVNRNPAECEADSQFQQACRLWQSKDLGANDQFFDFADVKPADHGTNVISLNVASNDAYVCLFTKNTHDNDNGLNDPEGTAGDTTDGADQGELSDYLNVVVWADDGDGVHQIGESVLYNGPLKNLLTSRLEVPTTGTEYLGLDWCAGTQTVAGDGTISCDGSGDQNDAQTDSFVADVVAYAVQQRNNDDFQCPSILPPR